MSEYAKYRNSMWLRKKYVVEEWSTYDIAEECDCSRSTVRKWMDEYNIQRRGSGLKVESDRLQDKTWLRKKYVVEEWSIYDIAEECDCSDSTVRKWMDEHNIERRRGGPQVKFERLEDEEWLREQYIEKGKTGGQIAESLGCTDAAVYISLDEHGITTVRNVTNERLRDPDFLREHHLNLERSGVEIAQDLDCTPETVYNWLRKHNIEVQNHYKGPTGPEHPNWKGGRVPYGPGWSKSKRQTVRERDDYTCQDPRCSVTQTEHLDEYSQKLHVHHLRKARDVDDPEQRNAKENLITLCLDCHPRWEKIADAGLVPEVLSK